MAKINLNTASKDEIAPIIGQEKAQDLIDYREKNGGINSWDDLKKIPGMSEEMVNRMKQSTEL